MRLHLSGSGLPHPVPDIPEGPRPPAAPLEAAFEPPDAGWIILWLTFGEAKVRIRLSYNYDPLAGLLDWLLDVAAGEEARLTIDEEGIHSHLVATAGDGPGLVRLTVWQTEPLTLVADRQVERDALLRGVREGVRSFWDKPDRERFWNDWFRYGCPEWREDHPDWAGPRADWGRLDEALSARAWAARDG